MTPSHKANKEEYIFDVWKPNIPLLILSLLMFTWIITINDDFKLNILITFTFLIFGWSITFSRKEVNKK